MRKTQFGILLLAVITLVFNVVHAQNLSTNGRFSGKHFSIKEYGSAAQIWTGIQHKDGQYIFGNRQDILCFNGNEWSKVKVDKEKTSKEAQTLAYGSFVSHFFTSSSGTIFVGRENNFGYLGNSSKGELTYYPLLTKNEKDGFGKIWNIFEVNNGEVLFIGLKSIFTYKNGSITKYNIPAGFSGMVTKTSCRVGRGMLLVYQTEEEISKRKNKFLYIDILTGRCREVNGPETGIALNIRGSFEIDGKWYVLDLSKTLFQVIPSEDKFIWKATPSDFFPFISKYAPNYIARVDHQIYYCTENGGLIISNLKGEVTRVFDFNDELDNIFIHHFFIDHQKNIWLCLDNGIQFLETSSPLTYFKKKEGITSQIECIEFVDQHALIGLHTDIFLPVKKNDHSVLEPINQFGQYIFDIETLHTKKGKKTLVIGYNGLFEYFPATKTYKNVSPVYALSFAKDPTNPNRLFIALEAGLGQLELDNSGKWIYSDLVPDAGGETVSAAYLNGKVYFSIRNKGIGIYTLASKHFRILPIINQDKDNNNYYVQRFQNTIYVGTGNGIFFINSQNSKLERFRQNDEFLGVGHKNTIHRLINIEDRQLWVVTYKEFSDDKFEFETGWIEKNGNNWEYTKWPLSGLKDAGIISAIQQGPNNEIWLGANEGLFIFNPDAVRTRTSNLKIHVDRLEINGKIVAYDLRMTKKLEPLVYQNNSFKVVFHANCYSAQGPTMYRYKLEGFNDDWTEWSNLDFANFVKISEGTYTLKLQARNFYGQESEIYTYEITILPPWYRTFWAYLLYIIALIFVIIGVVQLSTKRVKRQNQKLEETVQARTKEIAEQNHQLEKQKEEITQKTTDILDSIHYAKRIQTTILPGETRLNELFDEHFVFYRPKDIVSGDFYWARDVQGKMIFSAIDCTGHGVPGALVSIVGNNGLLRAVNEFRLTEPNEILDKLREIVVNAFRSEGQADVKDGMDIALCSIDYSTGILKFSGANNECVIIRNGEIIELKPDKQPIGQFVDAKPFTLKSFDLEPGDCIYLYTDGYVDQFGGERMKKFKSKPFKALLSQIAALSMKEQYKIIQRTFDTWKEDLEQVDDVCVFGVKFIGKRS